MPRTATETPSGGKQSLPRDPAGRVSGVLSWSMIGARVHVLEYLSQGETQRVVKALRGYGIVLEGESHALCG
jgi:hypothetical protein